MICGRRLLSTGQEAQAECALVAAILVQAVKDARRGCEDAAAWLAEDGADLAEFVFDLHPDTVAQWRGSAGARVHMHRAARGRYWRERQAAP